MDYYNNAKNNNIFFCEKCNFNCCKKSNFETHLLTKKHLRVIEGDLKNAETITYTCICGKLYKHKQGLWKHKKVCLQSLDNKIEKKNRRNKCKFYSRYFYYD